MPRAPTPPKTNQDEDATLRGTPVQPLRRHDFLHRYSPEPALSPGLRDGRPGRPAKAAPLLRSCLSALTDPRVSPHPSPHPPRQFLAALCSSRWQESQMWSETKPETRAGRILESLDSYDKVCGKNTKRRLLTN